MAAIDHLVRFVPELGAGIAAIERAHGVRPSIGGRHVGRGTHNALLALGDCYLELIAPDPAQPAPSGGRPFGIDVLDRPSYVAYAVRPSPGETLAGLVDALSSVGVEAGAVSAMSRTTPDGAELHWRLTFPSSEQPGVPFLIDWGDTTRPDVTAPRGPVLSRLIVRSPQVDTVRSVVRVLGLAGRVVVEPGPDAIEPVF